MNKPPSEADRTKAESASPNAPTSVFQQAGKFFVYFYPAFYASGKTFPAYKRPLTWILLLALLATSLEAAGLGAVYYLLKLLTGQPAESDTPFPFFDTITSSPELLTVGCVIFLTIAIRLKFYSVKATSYVSYYSSRQAGILCLSRARELHAEGRISSELLESSQARSQLLKLWPFACGFAANRISMVAISMVQGGGYLLLLLYLSPTVTLFFLLATIVFIAFVTLSFEKLLGILKSQREDPDGSKELWPEVVAAIQDRDLDEAEFAQQAEAVFADGPIHNKLMLRLSYLYERRSGSLFVEYIYPVAIVALAVLFFYSPGYAPDITELAIYFLLLRQVVVAFAAIGNMFMAMARLQPMLAGFQAFYADGVFAPESGPEPIEEEEV